MKKSSLTFSKPHSVDMYLSYSSSPLVNMKYHGLPSVGVYLSSGVAFGFFVVGLFFGSCFRLVEAFFESATSRLVKDEESRTLRLVVGLDMAVFLM